MKYITLDTCVWLELLKANLHDEDNVFDEMCYWIENKYLTHIVPENIIREWNRHKVNKTLEIVTQIKSLQKSILKPFQNNKIINTIYQPESVEEIIKKRIERVENIFNVHSELARESEEIYTNAVKRNLECIAPNHSKDSFRDTINILTLTNYIKSKGYNGCCFTTSNFSDFSVDKSKKYDLHPQLIDDFRLANLEYVFFEQDSVESKLFANVLRPSLPSFQEYLKEIERQKTERLLSEKKIILEDKIESPDTDFLENIKYMDLILSKKITTAFEKELIGSLISRHESYKRYFFKNVGNNDMV